MPRPTREQEVDVAYALETSPLVRGVYALASPDSAVDHPDAVHFGVVLDPYSAASIVSVHFELLRATRHEVAGRVLYCGQAGITLSAPRAIEDGKRIVVRPHERNAARARFVERSAEVAGERRLEEEAFSRALADAFRRRPFGAPVRASLQSGEFEVVADPFPSEKLPPARVLVLDHDDSTLRSLAALGEVNAVRARDGWSALDAMATQDFDLVLCALTFDGWRGSEIYTMVAKSRPEMGARIVFLAREVDIQAMPPSAAIGRVLARPVDPDAVRRLIARGREGRKPA